LYLIVLTNLNIGQTLFILISSNYCKGQPLHTRRGTVVKAVLVPLDPSGAEIPEDRALPLEEGANPTGFSPCDMIRLKSLGFPNATW